MGYYHSRVNAGTIEVNESDSLDWLSRCAVCGTQLVFHLCPNCDRNIIKARQKRLEIVVNRARSAEEIKRQFFRSEMIKRDSWASQELEHHTKKPDATSTLKSILGLVFSVPMSLIGLQMVLDAYYYAVGIAMILGGAALLLHSVFAEMASQNHKYAKEWLKLTPDVKFRLIEEEETGLAVSPQTHNGRRKAFTPYTDDLRKAF
ncbi:MAG: hypothetical protein R6U89_07615 [Dehalococcoidia bacterium]